MKLLILCEGAAEKAIINILLDSNKLKFDRDDLIGLGPYICRQLKNSPVVSELENYNDEVMVYRIGDLQTDVLKIPHNLKHIVSENRIRKYVVKSEFEALILINEGLYNDYNNQNQYKASEFLKSKVLFNRKKYNKSEEQINDYYRHRVHDLVNNITEYKRIKKHNKGELYLFDLLK